MNDEPVYAAIVTIKVPQSGQSASVTVVLTPPDTVLVDGRVKPLADCTLRDLQAFADELEADVWDAYEAITLLELDEQQKAEIEVTVLDRQGKTRSLENIWQRQAIILPAESETEETAVAAQDHRPPRDAPHRVEARLHIGFQIAGLAKDRCLLAQAGGSGPLAIKGADGTLDDFGHHSPRRSGTSQDWIAENLPPASAKLRPVQPRA